MKLEKENQVNINEGVKKISGRIQLTKFETKKNNDFDKFGYSGIFDELNNIAKDHKSFLHLSNCDPPVYGYKLDKKILERIDQLRFSDFTNYPNWNGDEDLRIALTKRIQEMSNVLIHPDKIILTYGVSEGFPLTFDALFHKNPGSIAIPDPSYIPLIVQAKRFGKIWFYPCNEEEDWNPDLELLTKCLENNPETRAIVIITPNSPTGAVYPEKVLRELVNIAAQYNLIIFTNEIYDSISFSNFFSPLQFASEVPVVYMNGFSKVYRLPGYRLGYLGWYDPLDKFPGFWDHLVHLCKARLGITLLAQEVAKIALQEPQESTMNYVNSIQQKHRILINHLNQITDLSTVPAKGGTYIFPKVNLRIDDETIVKSLLKKHGILITPGSAYGPELSPGHLRIVTLETEENLIKGVQALDDTLKTLK